MRNPVQQYLDSITLSITSKNYFAALSIALMLPDICSAIQDKSGTTNGNLYSNWFDTYLSKYYSSLNSGKEIIFLSGKECYAIRCSYLHQGIHEISHQKVLAKQQDNSNHIKFMAEMTSDKIKLGDTLCLSLENFCNYMIDGVNEWIVKNSKNKLVTDRISQLPKVYTSSFSPMFGVVISQ
jgi:hypothetical protein